MMTNVRNTVIYTGVTNNLEKRILQHRGLINPGSFTCRYSVTKLVYYEAYWDIRDAIAREKQIKQVRAARKSS
jgi:putative endonuclease